MASNRMTKKNPKNFAHEHKLYRYYYHFGGHWGNKTEKNDSKTVWIIMQACEKAKITKSPF